MAWDDPSSLWWLRPNQDANHSAQISSGFALGMRQAQQQQEMQLNLKQLAFQQQYRTDQLDAENRRIDELIKNYQRLKDQSTAEQEDMQKLSFAMPELQAGIQIPLDLKTPKGLKALNDIYREVDYQKSIQHENAAAVKAMSDFRKQLARVWGADPATASDISSELDKTGKITDWMQARVNDVIDNLVVPKEMESPTGMELSRINKPTSAGGTVGFVNVNTRVGSVETYKEKAAIAAAHRRITANTKALDSAKADLALMSPNAVTRKGQEKLVADLQSRIDADNALVQPGAAASIAPSPTVTPAVPAAPASNAPVKIQKWIKVDGKPVMVQ